LVKADKQGVYHQLLIMWTSLFRKISQLYVQISTRGYKSGMQKKRSFLLWNDKITTRTKFHAFQIHIFPHQNT